MRWMKTYDRWTEWEDATLVRMRREGASYRAIGVFIKRSENACSSRVSSKHRDHLTHRLCRRPKLRPPPPRVTIDKSLIPEFYALGWRVVGFDAHSCTMEWPHAAEPWRPIAMREAA